MNSIKQGCLACCGLAALILLSGCMSTARDLGYAGKNPGGVTCSGKAVITIQGSLNIGSGVTGGGSDNGTISFDCGSGAWIKQGIPTPDAGVGETSPVPTPTPAPVTAPPSITTAPVSGAAKISAAAEAEKATMLKLVEARMTNQR